MRLGQSQLNTNLTFRHFCCATNTVEHVTETNMVLLFLFMLIDVTFLWVYTPKSDICIHANHISSFIFGRARYFCLGIDQGMFAYMV